MATVLVTGATGKQGGAVADLLLEQLLGAETTAQPLERGRDLVRARADDDRRRPGTRAAQPRQANARSRSSAVRRWRR